MANPQYFHLTSVDFWVNSIVILCTPIFYFYSRTHYYKRVAQIFIVLLTGSIYFLALPYGDEAYPGAFNYLTIPILLTIFFVNLRAAVWLTLFNTLATILLGIFYKDLSSEQASPGFVSLLSCFLLAAFYYQQVIFQGQQAQLQAQEKLQHQLELEQQRVQVLNNLVLEISHDLKTPLSILHNKFYLVGKAALDERQQQHLSGAEAQVNHITEMVNQLVTLVKLDSTPDLVLGPLAPLPILQTTLELFRGLAAEKAIQLEGDWPTTLPTPLRRNPSLTTVWRIYWPMPSTIAPRGSASPSAPV